MEIPLTAIPPVAQACSNKNENDRKLERMARLPWIWRQSASHRGGAGENGKTFYEESISVSIMLDAEKEHQENFHSHRQLLCHFFCHPPRHRHQTRVERALNMHAQNLFIATGTGKK